MNEDLYVKICPKCGGTDIDIPPAGLDFKMTQPDYCEKCKNSGNFPEILFSEVKDFCKHISK